MTTDLLLSVSDLFLTMGLPSIDESLDKLLVAMESFPKSAILGDTVGYARVLGLLRLWRWSHSRSQPSLVTLLAMPVSSVCCWLCVSAPTNAG